MTGTQRNGAATAGGVALFGCGYWGKNLARNLSALGALHAIVETHPAGRALAGEVAPGVPVVDDPREVLSDPAVRGVMIATPAETHFALASAALEAGKDVFVEKPLTIDVDEGRALSQRAQELDRILMVGHLLEYHPAILKIRELIETGELGKLRYITSNRLNLGKIRTEENALWSFAPHDLAVILRLVGQMPFEVVATGGSYVQPNVADVTVTQLLFDNGVRAHIYVSWLHPFKEQRLVVIGSKRMVSFDDVTKELLSWDVEVDWREGQPVPKRHPGIPVEIDWSEEPLRNECRHFLDCIEARRAPLTDGRSGVDVLKILHASQRSLTRNGAAIAVPSEPTLGAPAPRFASHMAHS